MICKIYWCWENLVQSSRTAIEPLLNFHFTVFLILDFPYTARMHMLSSYMDSYHLYTLLLDHLLMACIFFYLLQYERCVSEKMCSSKVQRIWLIQRWSCLSWSLCSQIYGNSWPDRQEAHKHVCSRWRDCQENSTTDGETVVKMICVYLVFFVSLSVFVCVRFSFRVWLQNVWKEKAERKVIHVFDLCFEQI